MALFGRKNGKSLFGKRKTDDTPKKPQRHELVDIPIDSMIELSDITTYEETGDTSHAYKLVTRKKYVGEGLHRYMYHIEDAEKNLVVLGIDHIAGTKDEYEISRWIVDGEEQLDEPLPEEIVLHYPHPDNEDEEIEVVYGRQEVISATLTVTTAQGQDEFAAELHEYTTDEDEFMSVELCGDWLTFYVGALITRSDIEIYPAIEATENRKAPP